MHHCSSAGHRGGRPAASSCPEQSQVRCARPSRPLRVPSAQQHGCWASRTTTHRRVPPAGCRGERRPSDAAPGEPVGSAPLEFNVRWVAVRLCHKSFNSRAFRRREGHIQPSSPSSFRSRSDLIGAMPKRCLNGRGGQARLRAMLSTPLRQATSVADLPAWRAQHASTRRSGSAHRPSSQQPGRR